MRPERFRKVPHAKSKSQSPARTAHAPPAAHERLGVPEQLEHRRMMRRRLKGRNLACHCGGGLPCHGEVLAAMANDYPAAKAAIQELRRSSMG